MSRVEIPRIDFKPPVYVCQRATKPFSLDGNILKEFWDDAPFTNDFVDIEGVDFPKKPYFKTQAKMLWDSENFYFGAILYGDEIWGTLTERDCVIFYDNDFEIFIDPDSDSHGYFEYEMNVLNTVWDLFLPKPYRDQGRPLNGWDIHGLQSAVHVEGEINNPSAKSSYWSVEVVIPFKALMEMSARKAAPVAGDYYRVNFSRVQWPVDVVDNTYVKRKGPEENWVWAPTGVINIHYPELWGFVFFADGNQEYTIPEEERLSWELRRLYYYEHRYYEIHGTFTESIDDLDIPNFSVVPKLEVTTNCFEASLYTGSGKRGVSINHEGLVQFFDTSNTFAYLRQPPTLYDLSREEQEGLNFLYKNLPLSDLTAQNHEFFIDVVKHAYRVKKEMPWGKEVSDDDFLQFVIPCHINNEHLEFYQEIFYNELKPRIAQMSRKEAAIEINFWCFEKATYQPTSMRTAAPLTTLKNAFGRCGEESTLAVAAFRSVGIPARQCYVPRWSHSDDNHAWVEVQTEDGWEFLGACEPEIRLNQGWFVEPASRAMLVQYHGVYGKVNILNHYAKTKHLLLKIQDINNNPIPNATVLLQVVNYSQFSSIKTLIANDQGEVSFETGYGDLVVRGYCGNLEGECVVVKEQDGVIPITLKPLERIEFTQEYTLRAPEPGGPFDSPLGEVEKEIENQRKEAALGVRKAYESTFLKDQGEILENAKGNHPEIVQFIERGDSHEEREWRLKLLSTLSQKDLSDTTANILEDHFIHSMPYKDLYDEESFLGYIVKPQVWIEKIETYRSAVLQKFSDREVKSIKKNPRWLARWIACQIGTVDLGEVNNLTYSVESMLNLGVGNDMSRKILAVAILRTVGIMARLREENLHVEYQVDGTWRTLFDESPQSENLVQLILEKDSNTLMEYYKNFTIAQYEKSEWKTLHYPKIFWNNNISVSFSLPQGLYRIVTTKRKESGDLDIRVQQCSLQNTDKKVFLTPLSGDLEKLSVKVTHQDLVGDGIFCWIDPTHEPSVHLLHELLELEESYNRVEVPIHCMVQSKEQLHNALLQSVLKRVPTSIGTISGGEPLDILCKNLKIIERLPLVVIKRGDSIIAAWSGYQVGVGQQILEGVTS